MWLEIMTGTKQVAFGFLVYNSSAFNFIMFDYLIDYLIL